MLEFFQKGLCMKKISRRQQKAVEAAQRALDGIDMKKFWKKVMAKVIPKHLANERMRFNSWKNAIEHPRVLD